MAAYIPAGGRPALQLPVVTVPPELLGLALDIQEARVKAEVEGSLRQRMTNVRTDARSIPGPEGAGAPTASRWRMDERRVR